jgi:hypothetical protein
MAINIDPNYRCAIDALVALYHDDGFGRFIAETQASALALAAIERGMMDLGRAGGNMADSPLRSSWERARAVVHRGPFEGPHNRLPHDPA